MSDLAMAESKISQCIKLFQVLPDATHGQVLAIAAQVGCSERQAYRAKKVVHDANQKAQRQIAMSKGKKKKRSKAKTTRKSKKKKSTRGRKKTTPHNPTSHKSFQKPKRPLIPQIDSQMSFEHFCKYHAQPGYDGLYRWQIQWYQEVWPQKYSITKVARDHGKSVEMGDISQWAMSAQGYDILYLGWTTRRVQIAQEVYKFFLIRSELVSDKSTSQSHFRTSYGTKFDTYSIKSKEILGMHPVGDLNRIIIDENRYLEDYLRNDDRPLLMIIDDPIDGTFRKERHKGKTLEDFFLSTIISINPDKLAVVGTHKYEGDFLHFVKEVYGDDMYVFMRTPYLAKTDPRFGKEPDNPSNLLCPERWIDDGHPDYDFYLDIVDRVRKGEDPKNLMAFELELFKKEDLTKKKAQMKAYWWGAEYMQNPHPITGEVWSNLRFEPTFKGTAAYDLLVISIDRATTQNRKSDFTGITVFFREKGTNFKLVTNDYTQKIRITDLILFITELYEAYRKTYRYNIHIITVVEKQGGGDDFCDLAEDSGAPFAHTIIRVHNTRDKLERIEDNLGTPITNGEVGFADALKDSELVTEINSFPYCAYIDALDSLSNGYFEAEKIPQSKIDPDTLAAQLAQYNDLQKSPDKWRQIMNNMNQRRTIF